ncbi:MAG: UDP binding domain-containing protein [Cyanobacteria bacterium P01_F01_bin.56]
MDCDALVVVTDWPKFRELPYIALARTMRTPLLINGRNCINPDAIAQVGLVSLGIGRNPRRSMAVVSPNQVVRAA